MRENQSTYHSLHVNFPLNLNALETNSDNEPRKQDYGTISLGSKCYVAFVHLAINLFLEVQSVIRTV